MASYKVQAMVDTVECAVGTLKIVNHGKAFSIVLHPEHQQLIAALTDGAAVRFTDETNMKWKAVRAADTVYFSARGMKTSVACFDL